VEKREQLQSFASACGKGRKTSDKNSTNNLKGCKKTLRKKVPWGGKRGGESTGGSVLNPRGRSGVGPCQKKITHFSGTPNRGGKVSSTLPREQQLIRSATNKKREVLG